MLNPLFFFFMILFCTIFAAYTYQNWPSLRYQEHVVENNTHFSTWVRNKYVAADPEYQEYCRDLLLSNNQQSTSEFAQDLFVYFNFFKKWPMLDKTGFYVDSGANDAKEISNTFFFDKCLGWKGLCVEPLEKYHARLQSLRSCELIKECISSQKHTLQITGDGPNAAVGSLGVGKSIDCNPLHAMLKSRGHKLHVDFWSLDVEGHEISVLQSINFTEIYIGVVMIEDFWVPSRELDLLMSRNGFLKYHQLGVDAVYVNRKFPLEMQDVWYPDNFQQHIDYSQRLRRSSQSKLKC